MQSIIEKILNQLLYFRQFIVKKIQILGGREYQGTEIVLISFLGYLVVIFLLNKLYKAQKKHLNTQEQILDGLYDHILFILQEQSLKHNLGQTYLSIIHQVFSTSQVQYQSHHKLFVEAISALQNHLQTTIFDITQLEKQKNKVIKKRKAMKLFSFVMMVLTLGVSKLFS